MKKICAVFIVVLMFSFCVCPAMAKKVKKQSRTKRQPMKQEQTTMLEWYQGGDLHNKKWSIGKRLHYTIK